MSKSYKQKKNISNNHSMDEDNERTGNFSFYGGDVNEMECDEDECKVCTLYDRRSTKQLKKFFKMIHLVDCNTSYNIVAKEAIQYYRQQVFRYNSMLIERGGASYPSLTRRDIESHLEMCNMSPKQILRSDFNYCYRQGNFYKEKLNTLISNEDIDERESNLQLYNDLYTTNINNKIKLFNILNKKMR